MSSVYGVSINRGIFPGEFVPGRFEGWSLAAAAYAKESLNDLRKVPAKPYLVNLTLWEDRPRLNLWEEMVRQRQRKELEERENEARRQQEKMKVTD